MRTVSFNRKQVECTNRRVHSKNAQLRVDAKSANRRVAVLEEELAAANKRIDELEHALLEARHQNGVTASPAKGKLRG